ncbi:MAG TPA: LapA family protein [Polyangia bacterium]|jgi:uncharacterized integral membrane protein
MTLARIFFVMAATAAMVVFGAQNWDNVPIQLIFGPPAKVRLVFLLLMAAGAGYVAALVRGFTRELRLRGEVRQLRRQLRQAVAPRAIAAAPGDDELDELGPAGEAG